MFLFTTTAQMTEHNRVNANINCHRVPLPRCLLNTDLKLKNLHKQVGTRTAEGPGWTARAVPMDRGPQPEARGGDQRSEGERRADAVAAGAHRLLPGARHRERVRPGQAVP